MVVGIVAVGGIDICPLWACTRSRRKSVDIWFCLIRGVVDDENDIFADVFYMHERLNPNMMSSQ